MTDANQPDENGKLTIALPRFLQRWIRRIPKSTVRAAALFFALGAGLGLMFAVAFEAISWYRERPLPPRDLGSVDFGAVGLRGRLMTKWDQKAEYRVRFEPTAKDQTDKFALWVKEPPRPLKIKVYLSDSSGFTLCSREIALRFNFYRNLERMQHSANDPTRVAMAYANASENEGKWEANKDMFHDDLASDGKVEGISSEGEMQCPRNAYTQATRWGFSSNFPTTAEQDDLLKSHSEVPKESGDLPSKRAIAARKSKEDAGAPQSPLVGDDVISGYSVPAGSIETSGGLTFFVYKEGERDNAIIWQVNSARIHYQCDENSMCTLKRAGTAVVLHAKLQK